MGTFHRSHRAVVAVAPVTVKGVVLVDAAVTIRSQDLFKSEVKRFITLFHV
jgi:hypothetical protein